MVDLGAEQRNVKEGGYALDIPHSGETPVGLVNTVWNLPEDGGKFIVS